MEEVRSESGLLKGQPGSVESLSGGASREATMHGERIEKIWYRTKPITEPRAKDDAIRERGVLTIGKGGLHFESDKNGVSVDIANVNAIRYGLHGEMTNPTVRVIYNNGGEEEIAYFTDGRIGGIQGMFGGTEQLAKKMEHLAPVEIDASASRKSRGRWILILIMLILVFLFRVILR